jgi:hypothetical protein
MDFEIIRSFTKPLHVLIGAIILLSGLLQMILPKHGKRHRVLGQIYFWSMVVSFLTAFPSSIVDKNYFLAIVGLFSIYLSFTGGRFAMLKGTQPLSIFDRVGLLFFFFNSLLMAAFAVFLLVKGNLSGGIIVAVFAFIFCSGTFRDVYYVFLVKKPELMYGGMKWFFNHIGRIIGSYIAAITAFLVNVQPFGSHVVNWLLPTLLGSFVIARYLRRYKAKFSTE